jgi:hypothetical protein
MNGCNAKHATGDGAYHIAVCCRLSEHTSTCQPSRYDQNKTHSLWTVGLIYAILWNGCTFWCLLITSNVVPALGSPCNWLVIKYLYAWKFCHVHNKHRRREIRVQFKLQAILQSFLSGQGFIFQQYIVIAFNTQRKTAMEQMPGINKYKFLLRCLRIS